MLQGRPLFRALLRQSYSIPDYNFRNYALRRVVLGFRQNEAASGDQLSAALIEGNGSLQVTKRQAMIGQMYPHEFNVLEQKKNLQKAEGVPGEA
jgi:hypothetical protein